MNQSPESADTISPVTASIADLAWMTGSWYGCVDSDCVDEHWSTPDGGGMLGMFRWIRNGRLYLYEILAIEPEDSSLVLRLKHFDHGLIGWEEKDMAVAYPLVSIGNHEAVFERGGTFRSTRFVYKRTDNDNLIVIAEDRKGDGVTRNEFRYTRR